MCLIILDLESKGSTSLNTKPIFSNSLVIFPIACLEIPKRSARSNHHLKYFQKPKNDFSLEADWRDFYNIHIRPGIEIPAAN